MLCSFFQISRDQRKKWNSSFTACSTDPVVILSGHWLCRLHIHFPRDSQYSGCFLIPVYAPFCPLANQFYFECVDCWEAWNGLLAAQSFCLLSWIPIIYAWHFTCSRCCYRLRGTNTLVHKMLSSQQLSLPVRFCAWSSRCKTVDAEFSVLRMQTPKQDQMVCGTHVYPWYSPFGLGVVLCAAYLHENGGRGNERRQEDSSSGLSVSQLSFDFNTCQMLRKSLEPSNRRDLQFIYSFSCLPSNSSQKNHLPIQSPAFAQASTKSYIPTRCIKTATQAKRWIPAKSQNIPIWPSSAWNVMFVLD